MRIPLIQVHKYLVEPFDPGNDLTNGFPTSDAQYFTATIQVVNDDGSPPKTPVSVYLDDDQNALVVNYWDNTKANVTAGVKNAITPVPLKTNDTGFLRFYVGISTRGDPNYPGCIFKLFAGLNADPKHTGGVSQSLTAMYWDVAKAQAVASSDLLPLVLRNFEEGIVLIPEWGYNYQYSTPTSLNNLDANTNPSAPISIAVNGQLILRDYTYQDLQYGVDIPYGLMNLGSQNSIVYLVDDGSPQLAPPWEFKITGMPMYMPDPEKSATLPSPWWFGAPAQPPHVPNKEPLILSDLYDTNDQTVSFQVRFPYAEGVRPGDIYNIFIYMNGYDTSGLPIRRMLGDGSPLPPPYNTFNNIIPIKAPPGVAAGQIGTADVPARFFQGFGQKETRYPGYLWVDYLVNGEFWSNPWISNERPVKIDFSGTLPGETATERAEHHPKIFPLKTDRKRARSR